MNDPKVTAVWRCPACGLETHQDTAWSFLAFYDEQGALVADTHSCPRCLIAKLTELLPQMVRVEEA